MFETSKPFIPSVAHIYYVSLESVATTSILQAAGSLFLIWLITKFRKPQSLEIKFTSPWKEAVPAIAYVAALSLLLLLRYSFVASIAQIAAGPSAFSRQVDPRRALAQWGIYEVIFIAPVLFITGANFKTIGLRRKNLVISLGLGLVLSLPFMILNSPLSMLSNRFLNWNALWSLILCLAVGFGEELTFRGFLQIRLSAWMGDIKGFILASGVMALGHIPTLLAVGQSLPQAFLNAMLLMPISLTLGFLMLRTGNVIGPAVLHTVADWVGFL
jgi:membrane protease YdiL (CAAX protease family)